VPKQRRPSQSRRKRAQRPYSPPPPAATPPLIRPSPEAAPAAGVSTLAPARPREPSVTRFGARDYSYVRREVRRIAVLAVGIIVLIVVLSFFLP